MDLDYLSQKVSISRLHYRQMSANICFCKYYYFSLHKHWLTYGIRSNLKLTHFPTNDQDPSKILEIFILKVYLKIYIYENYNLFLKNYGNFYLIGSNDVSVFSQDNALSECHHLFHNFYLKFATMNGQT